MRISLSSIPENLSLPTFRLLLLQVMVIQNSAAVLVGRHTRASGLPKSQLYVVNHFLLVCEAVKMLVSCILEYNLHGDLRDQLQQHVLGNPIDCLKIIMPSLIYLVQNMLVLVALSNLSPPIYQVLFQAKLLTTALISVMLLQRKYSVKQWICLTALALGVAFVVLAEDKNLQENKQDHEQNFIVGFVSVVICCFSSAFAGVYIEMVLKNVVLNRGTTTIAKNSDTSSDKRSNIEPPSLWMRNIQMAFFSVVMVILQWPLLSREEKQKPFLHGFTFWVWILVVLQSVGGLLIAAIIKYTDNVLKGLAAGVATVATTLFSFVFFDTHLTLNFIFGSATVVASVYFFSNDIPCSSFNGHSPCSSCSGVEQGNESVQNIPAPDSKTGHIEVGETSRHDHDAGDRKMTDGRSDEIEEQYAPLLIAPR